jgi:hypothetical protein
MAGDVAVAALDRASPAARERFPTATVNVSRPARNTHGMIVAIAFTSWTLLTV